MAAGAASLAIGLLKQRGIDPLPEQIEEILRRGSPSGSQFIEHSAGGRYLNLETLIDFIDADTGVDSRTTASRETAAGQVGILSFSAADTDVNSGDPIELTVELTANSSVAVEYHWFRNGIRQAAHRKPTLKINRSALANAGEYHVEVVSGKTKASSNTITISVDGLTEVPKATEQPKCE
ncbi:MAG: hypothetical protein R2827_15965 [Bdellovibrionales bacterium]